MEVEQHSATTIKSAKKCAAMRYQLLPPPSARVTVTTQKARRAAETYYPAFLGISGGPFYSGPHTKQKRQMLSDGGRGRRHH